MKKIFAIAAALLLTVSAFAQDGKSIYNKYSDAEKVSAVYISPAMFRLMGKLPDMAIEDSGVNLGSIIKSLNGMYILNSRNPRINEDLRNDTEKFIAKGKYEMLMEAKEGGETVRMYTVGDEKIVTGFVMLTRDKDECNFICMDGEMPREALEKLLADSL